MSLTPARRPRRRGAAVAGAALLAASACGSAGDGTGQTTGAGPRSPSAASSPASPTTAGAPTASAPAGPSVDPARAEVIVTGLEVPWGVAFLPGGDALVSERETARVLRVPAAGGDAVEVGRVAEAAPRGEGGLLGLAVSPGFAQDRLVYAYVTTSQDNRIVRFPLPEQPGGALATEPVLTGIPAGSTHNGGRIAFGPDRNLYAGTGDAGDPSRAQRDDSLGGKVLAMTPQGEPLEGATSLVLSKGHRNVQGLAFDDDDRLWATDFGQNRYDEVNRIEPGANYGWPEVEGPGDGGGRFRAPVVVWDPAEASPSGAAVVGSDLWVAALRGERLWRVPLTGPDSAGEPEAVLRGDYGRIRHAQRAPDGALWVLTSNRDGRGDPVAADDRVVRLPAG